MKCKTQIFVREKKRKFKEIFTSLQWAVWRWAQPFQGWVLNFSRSSRGNADQLFFFNSNVPKYKKQTDSSDASICTTLMCHWYQVLLGAASWYPHHLPGNSTTAGGVNGCWSPQTEDRRRTYCRAWYGQHTTNNNPSNTAASCCQSAFEWHVL